MSYVNPIPANQHPDVSLRADTRADQRPSALSALSWSAIFAGAATAASLWMILMILGAGLGLTSIPYWLDANMSASTFGIATIAWLVFSQVAASGMGGYIAGRFRTRWVDVPGDEVWFRDTAHGFLAWAVSALVTATFLTGMIGGVISGGIDAGAAATEAAIAGESIADRGGMSDQQGTFGQSQSRRVDVDVNERTLAEQALNAAEQTRKTAATAAIWLFISLLSGAFLASLMAIFGGRQRDAY